MAWMISSPNSARSDQCVSRSDAAKPASSMAPTTPARHAIAPRRRADSPSSARKCHSVQAAIAVLHRPNRKPVRTSPRRGASTSGNSSDTASAPR